MNHYLAKCLILFDKAYINAYKYHKGNKICQLV